LTESKKVADGRVNPLEKKLLAWYEMGVRTKNQTTQRSMKNMSLEVAPVDWTGGAVF